MKTKPIALCAHSGYQASFEGCFVNLGGLENQFLAALLENGRRASQDDVVLCQFS